VKYHVTHHTAFRYSQAVSVSHQVMHLSPRSTERQRVSRAAIDIEPVPVVRDERTDYFGNTVTYVTIQEPHTELTVTSEFDVDVQPSPGLGFDLSPPWEQVAALLAAPSRPNAIAASQFAFASPYVTWDSEVRDFALESFAAGLPLLTSVRGLTARIHRDFKYEGNVTDVWTPVHRVLAERRGVCQDFAHLEVACLRSLGLAARYSSGYLRTRPAEGKERLVGADASHAWIGVWSPDVGWVEFDPTNNVVPSDEHITVAWGRDYGDVSPINGFIVGGGAHSVSVGVDVSPV
jgi:transglutaminase-like putative cysteine protease